MVPQSLVREMVDLISRAVPSVEAVYLFGSRARGVIHPGSDLDLALLLPVGQELDDQRRIDLAVELAVAARCEVDLSVLDLGRGVVHAKEVVATGIPIFVRREAVRQEFEMSALSRYARLNEDRAPVLAAYSAEVSTSG